ncbi:hypothetical protein QTN25_009555 [Entamoeba marina]
MVSGYSLPEHESIDNMIFINSNEYIGYDTLIMRSCVSEYYIKDDYEFFKTIYLPNTLKEIPSDCICAQDLCHIHIPTSVTKICDKAFSDLRNMSDLFIPPTVKYIGKYVFSYLPPRTVMMSEETICDYFTFFKDPYYYDGMNLKHEDIYLIKYKK